MTSRLAALALPAGSTFIRSTAEFGADSVPPGLLSSHRVALDDDARFVVEFYR
jgi:hypothetical protein